MSALGAFLGEARYGALVVPLTYGYAQSSLRIPVYDRLAKDGTTRSPASPGRRSGWKARA